MSRGLAPKYHGPFVIVGKYTNGCDYLIRPHNQPKARVRQMHQNNLKIYHKRGHPIDQIKIDPTPNLDLRLSLYRAKDLITKTSIISDGKNLTHNHTL